MCLTPTEIEEQLQQLNLTGEVAWYLEGHKLCSEFVFRDFATVFEFMVCCAGHAERLNHHPEWCNAYNKVSVQLTTHEAGGLTQLDFELAAAMAGCIAKI